LLALGAVIGTFALPDRAVALSLVAFAGLVAFSLASEAVRRDIIALLTNVLHGHSPERSANQPDADQGEV
jgi:hypothetical protein